MDTKTDNSEHKIKYTTNRMFCFTKKTEANDNN